MDAKQLAELEGLKKTLRCLVLSSATTTDARSLSRDFFNMEGERIPHIKFGYTSLLPFLKERCNDCLLFSGDPCNPIITPVVTERTKHINDMIARQKIPSTARNKVKRSSVMESQMTLNKSQPIQKSGHYKPQHYTNSNQTFRYNGSSCSFSKVEPERSSWRMTTQEIPNKQLSPKEKPFIQKAQKPIVEKEINVRREEINVQREEINVQREEIPETYSAGAIPKVAESPVREQTYRPITKNNQKVTTPEKEDLLSKSFANLSLTARYNMLYKNTIKSQLKELMDDYPNGIWLEDLNQIYSNKFEDGIDHNRLGYCDVASLCRDLDDTVRLERSATPGQIIVIGAQYNGPAQPLTTPSTKFVSQCARYSAKELDLSGDSDDALPGVPYDEGIFPEDCMGLRESIPTVPAHMLQAGAMYDINVSEVLDPSHFWFQLRSDEHDLALDKVMDEMMEYYETGEGRTRIMEFGAVQVGQYCATKYDPDGWSRCVIVKIVDSDDVKVRQVDYGTVTRVSRSDLRVLPLRWASLQAQALRGCLANIRPVSGLSCWPYKTALRFHSLVNCVPLVAQVHSVDAKNQIVRLYLTDTTKEEDIYLNNVLVTEEHAEICDMHRDILEDFLLPSFEDIEEGVAMNLSDKAACVAAGVFPECLNAAVSLPVRVRIQEPVAGAAHQSRAPHPPHPTTQEHQHNPSPPTSYSNATYSDSESCYSSSTYQPSNSSVFSTMTLNQDLRSPPGYRPAHRNSCETIEPCSSAYASSYNVSKKRSPSQPVFASYQRKIAMVKPNANEPVLPDPEHSTAPVRPAEAPSTPVFSGEHMQYQYYTPSANISNPYNLYYNVSPVHPSSQLQYHNGFSQAMNQMNHIPPLSQIPYPPGFEFLAQSPAYEQQFRETGFQPGNPYNGHVSPSQFRDSPVVQTVSEANIALQIMQNTLGLTQIEMQMFLNTQRTNPEIAKQFLEERIKVFRRN